MSAQGVSKNMVGNCVLIFYGFCPRSSFTCSVTVCGVFGLPEHIRSLVFVSCGCSCSLQEEFFMDATYIIKTVKLAWAGS